MMRKMAAANALFDREQKEKAMKMRHSRDDLSLELIAPGAHRGRRKDIGAVDYFIKEVQRDPLSERRRPKHSLDLSRNNSY